MTVVVDPDLAPPSGTLLDDIIGRIRRELDDREILNTLSSDVDADVTEMVLDHNLEDITRGTTLSIDDEIMYVWDADVPNRTVQVRRGHNSVAADHGVGSLVVAGNLTRKQIVDAINDELASLSASGLYQMKSAAIPYSYGVISYPLPELSGANIYDLQYEQWGYPGTWLHMKDWKYSTTDTTLQIRSSGSVNVRVLYQAPFNRVSDGGEDMQVSSGLQSEANDILVWGACYRLTGGDEYKRNNFRSQGDTRRAQEVPYRAVALSRPDYKQLHDDRVFEERNRLNRFFPRRRMGW